MIAIPIYIDLIVSIVATSTGLAVLATKMGVLDKDTDTPVLTALAIAFGSLGWSIFALMAFAALTSIPLWAVTTNEWLGSWGYTSARLLVAIGWGLTLIHMSRFSEFMQCQRDINRTK